jgi:hypothetical protein
MNDETTNLDRADEDILTYTASDEALEAAAGTEGVMQSVAPQYTCRCDPPLCG